MTSNLSPIDVDPEAIDCTSPGCNAVAGQVCGYAGSEAWFHVRRTIEAYWQKERAAR